MNVFLALAAPLGFEDTGRVGVWQALQKISTLTHLNVSSICAELV